MPAAETGIVVTAEMDLNEADLHEADQHDFCRADEFGIACDFQSGTHYAVSNCPQMVPRKQSGIVIV